MKKTYEIPSENLAKLELRINSLARKAITLDLTEPTLEVISSRMVPILNRDGLESGLDRKVYNVTVTGQAPQIDGWTLIAIIEHGSERNVINKLPGHQDRVIPDHYRTIDATCGHCKLTRSRKQTYLILKETGKLLLVGSDCLKDFTGHKSPEALAKWYKHLEDTLQDAVEDLGGGSPDNWVSLPSYLTRVAAVIQEFGWTSRGAAENNGLLAATADIALDPDLDIEPLDEHSELAEATIAWVRNDLAEKDSLNDYEWNLTSIFGSEEDDHFLPRHAGYVASAINAFNKIETEKVLAESSSSEYQGEIKERLVDLSLTVLKRLEYEGFNYNDTLHITIMQDEDGNVYVWKTSAKKLNEGETYLITGTVKAHNEYKEIKQTILTRCKIKAKEAE